MTTAANDTLQYLFIVFQNKRLYISCESSAKQRIHKKHQVLLYSKDTINKREVSSAAILLASVRVKLYICFQ